LSTKRVLRNIIASFGFRFVIDAFLLAAFVGRFMKSENHMHGKRLAYQVNKWTKVVVVVAVIPFLLLPPFVSLLS